MNLLHSYTFPKNESESDEGSFVKDDEFRFLKQYSLLVLIGLFFSFTEETKILGEIMAIPILIGIIKALHVGILFRNGLSWFHQWILRGNDFETCLKRSVVYPIIVTMVGGIVVSALLMFVIPQFKEIFAGMRTELPWTTMVVFLLSDLMNDWWWLILPLAFGVPIMTLKAFSRRTGREALTPWLLKTPIFGSLYRKWLLICFFRNWSTNLQNGFTPVDGLKNACAKTASQADLLCIRSFLESDRVVQEELSRNNPSGLSTLLHTYGTTMIHKAEKTVKLLELLTILLMGLFVVCIVFSVFSMPFMGHRCICAD